MTAGLTTDVSSAGPISKFVCSRQVFQKCNLFAALVYVVNWHNNDIVSHSNWRFHSWFCNPWLTEMVCYRSHIALEVSLEQLVLVEGESES
jgi:hypothetical protein